MANKSMITRHARYVLQRAAELTSKDLIVTIKSRNARGADLLAAGQAYKLA